MLVPQNVVPIPFFWVPGAGKGPKKIQVPVGRNDEILTHDENDEREVETTNNDEQRRTATNEILGS